MKVLVTGGGGFIGSHLVEALLKAGHEVRVLDNFSTGRRENLASAAGRLEVVEGDVRDSAAAAAAVRGREAVCHLAALPSVPRSFRDPFSSFAVNAGGTVKVLEAARRAGVRRFIYSSSSSVYGDVAAEAKSEDLEPCPLSPYAVSKLSGESMCRLFRRVYGMETVSLRYFNVFGPRQDPRSEYAAVIPRFIQAALGGSRPTIYGDGRQTRDFTYVANVVRANLLALAAGPEAGGEVFNVACGEERELLALVGALGEITGKKLEPVFEPARAGDVRRSRAEIGRARKVLGYRPEVGWREGLEKTIAWLRENAVR